jgi:hypothetical protein
MEVAQAGMPAGPTVFRIVQDALIDVLEHAPSADRAVVTLHYDPTGVETEPASSGPPDSNRCGDEWT